LPLAAGFLSPTLVGWDDSISAIGLVLIWAATGRDLLKLADTWQRKTLLAFQASRVLEKSMI
jgi:hypothetical protein